MKWTEVILAVAILLMVAGALIFGCYMTYLDYQIKRAAIEYMKGR